MADFPRGCLLHRRAGGGFAFDNEQPRHRVFIETFPLASRPVTNAEYLAFMQDGGYEHPELWLSMGWATVQQEGWRAPLYWEERDGQWMQFTLSGRRPLDLAEPVVHVSYFEADAFARWAGGRLPTEAEWEVAASDVAIDGNFVEDGRFHPRPLQQAGPALGQVYGDVWEWTQSSYSPYPGFRTAPGALGEYKGKFMCAPTFGQFVAAADEARRLGGQVAQSVGGPGHGRKVLQTFKLLDAARSVPVQGFH